MGDILEHGPKRSNDVQGDEHTGAGASVPTRRVNEAGADMLTVLPARTDGGADDTQNVQRFLEAAALLFSRGLSVRDVRGPRSTDIDIYAIEGEIEIRAATPGGLLIVTRRRIRRHSLRWVRLWPYVAIVLAAAVAIVLVWRGAQVLDLLSTWSKGV
jgi:hypothetical protein